MFYLEKQWIEFCLFVRVLLFYKTEMDIRASIEKLAKLIDPLDGLISILNVATLNDGDEFLLDKTTVVLSIVNIEEDKTLKNQSVYIKQGEKPSTIARFAHPTKHFIISLLFSSYNKDFGNYLPGIDKLNVIINFFQQNTSLYVKDISDGFLKYNEYLQIIKENPSLESSYQRVTFETVSLSLDQLHQMWSYLGSRYMPSVLVKMRLISVQGQRVIPETATIKEFKIKLWEDDIKDTAGLLETKNHLPKE